MRRFPETRTLFLLPVILACVLAMAEVGRSHAASGCNSIRTEFERKVRPQMLRVVKKYLRDSNWFLVTLEKKQKGDHPVPAEINEAHKDMVQSCSTDQCRAQANELKAASIRVYEINRKWGKAGCKGRLDD